MKAVCMHESGGVDKLVYADVPDPVPGPGEVLVRVRACALNHLEVWATAMPAGTTYSKPRIMGSDVAGVVEVVGEGLSGIQAGQKVMLQPGLSCGLCQSCLAGSDNLCPAYAILGVTPDWPGGFAELVKVPAANLIPLPENLSFEGAAALPLTFVTAWHMLVTRAGLRPGEAVLVNAAGAGVGIAAVQIAKLQGAHVIASAGADWKLQRAKELGADETINYNSQDLAQAVLRLTENRGVDVVFEHVGGEIFAKSLQCLAARGRLVTCGATAGPAANIVIHTLYRRQHAIIGSFMGTKGELRQMVPYFRDGRLKPVVDSTFPLKEAGKAIQKLASRDHFGKIVVVP